MSETIVSVEKLSKRYRIGAREQGYRTFREAIIDGLMGPVRNFKRLRKLTNFNDTKQNQIAGSSLADPDVDNTWQLFPAMAADKRRAFRFFEPVIR